MKTGQRGRDSEKVIIGIAAKKMLVRHNIKNTSAGISHEPSAPALVRFSRPHTVFGTMVSCNKEVKWTFQLLIVIG